jgi:autotransporter family porin
VSLTAWAAVLVGAGGAGAALVEPASQSVAHVVATPTPGPPPSAGPSGTPSIDPSAGPVDPGTDPAEPSTDPVEPSTDPSTDPEEPAEFVTLPPGSVLPGDQACAAAVTPAAETQPVNVRYNARRGTIRLPEGFFPDGSHDVRATTVIAARVTGAHTGTTDEILQWTACKWGVDEAIVRAQAYQESSQRQTMKGDWTKVASRCAPGHGLGVDGRPGWCPESWGILQVRYHYFKGAFPDAITSTAFNADTAYAVWRACFEGYEWWLDETASPERRYAPGDAWGCLGRWYSGRWYDDLAVRYIDCMQRLVHGRPPCD